MLSLRPHCCAAGRTSFGRQIRSAFAWLLPGTTLLLVPKCPLCIVTYVAMFSGIGLSVSTASNLRIGLIAISSAVLLYLAFRWLQRFFVILFVFVKPTHNK